MCHTTKDHIVLTLRELMKDTPLRKIRVHDVMTAAGMTRQSFYYHFKDIYHVIEWEVERTLLRSVRSRTDLDLFSMYRFIIHHIDCDSEFFRRVVLNMDEDTIRRSFMPLYMPYVREFLFGSRNPAIENDSPECQYSSYLVSELLFHETMLHASRKIPLTADELTLRMNTMDRILLGIRQSVNDPAN